MTTTPATPFDLCGLRRACAPVISWYERFLAERRLDLHELDEALTDLRRLPPVGGRIGRAVATIVSGGAGASIEEVLVAFEMLRGATGLRSQPPAGRSSRAIPRRARGGWAVVEQQALPGLEHGPP